MRIVVALLLAFSSTTALANHGKQTWEITHRSVIAVLPTWPGYEKPGFGAPKGVAPEGSGISITLESERKSDLVLTAAHVVDQATRVQIRDSDKGALLDAEILWIDNEADIALLRTTTSRPVLHLTTTSVTRSDVCAIANPFGLGHQLRRCLWNPSSGSALIRWKTSFKRTRPSTQAHRACTCRRKW